LRKRQGASFRQHLIERRMQEIMKFDEEFRREAAAGSASSQKATELAARTVEKLLTNLSLSKNRRSGNAT